MDSQPPLENTQAITKEAEEVAKTLTTLEETVIPEESSDVYCNIKEVIINKIRPILLEDGGDIELEGAIQKQFFEFFLTSIRLSHERLIFRTILSLNIFN